MSNESVNKALCVPSLGFKDFYHRTFIENFLTLASKMLSSNTSLDFDADKCISKLAPNVEKKKAHPWLPIHVIRKACSISHRLAVISMSSYCPTCDPPIVGSVWAQWVENGTNQNVEFTLLFDFCKH